MSDNLKPSVLPIYFVADESGSMSPFVAVLNQGLLSLYDTMQSEPLAASKVRFSVLGFSDGVRAHLSLAQLAEIEREAMPRLGASGRTSYLNLFEDLVTRIPADVAALKRDCNVHLPAIFFLTDGEPDPEPWEAAYARLGALPIRPNVLAFGARGARESTLVQLATRPEWASIVEDGADTGTALAAFMVELTRSVVRSGQALADGGGEVLIERPDMFRIATPLI